MYRRRRGRIHQISEQRELKAGSDFKYATGNGTECGLCITVSLQPKSRLCERQCSFPKKTSLPHSARVLCFPGNAPNLVRYIVCHTCGWLQYLEQSFLTCFPYECHSNIQQFYHGWMRRIALMGIDGGDEYVRRESHSRLSENYPSENENVRMMHMTWIGFNSSSKENMEWEKKEEKCSSLLDYCECTVATLNSITFYSLRRELYTTYLSIPQTFAVINTFVGYT